MTSPITPSPRPRAARIPAAERRAQLLTAAYEVFFENGFHGASMDDIADRASVSKPVLYQHFEGKDSLYLVLLDACIGSLAASLRDAMSSTTDNQKRIEATLRAFYTYAEKEHRGYRIIFNSDVAAMPEVAKRLELFHHNFMMSIAELLVEDTGMPQIEAELLARGLAGAAQISARGWAMQPHGERVSPERAVTIMTSLFWDGVALMPGLPK
ncbi:TetR/AcrR family transcriptional regulator [Falsarthrobacter nasiphocae]|uniref:AcrR family transcriptional regulator n=1 Tax=Falsarthrobacter nasiphocae TaxID=189863 RepID=A0AAE3YGF0_9MICC|nr:TetR/AcrR family transcriptional regulator [Falsarthrobacter nasiphocae]MDR6891463.1 AcrR family transcriptional regulator [Falsarthrobacter nasiphocae]